MKTYQYSVRIVSDAPVDALIISGKVEAYSLSEAIKFVLDRHKEDTIASLVIRR